MAARVLLLGGTAEAGWLARELIGWPAVHLITSLAGRVRDPLLPPGEVRIGGFGGQRQLVQWLSARRVRAVIDATHPFAAAITAAAVMATAELGLPFVVLHRPGWQAGPGDRWHWADSLDHAAGLVARLGRRGFLTTGRTGLAAFAGRDEVWFLIRTIDAPGPPLPAGCEVVLDRGPFTVDGELDLLRRYRIDVLVTKDSGGELTAAKLVAARRLGLAVLLVRRPPVPAVPVLATGPQVLRWLAMTLG
ncbi:MAG: cobalt-precorrin-6A reductase [Pseudonocardiaceae bacterium]